MTTAALIWYREKRVFLLNSHRDCPPIDFNILNLKPRGFLVEYIIILFQQNEEHKRLYR